MNSSLQFCVLLDGELEPDGSATVGDARLQRTSIFEHASLAPPLIYLDDLVGGREGELAGELGQAVLLQKGDAPAILSLELHEDAAMGRLLPAVHRLHEIGHGEIVGEDKANMPLSSQVAEIKEKLDQVCAVFDADRLQMEMERDLPKALRDLADAIESGQMSGKMAGFTPWGLRVDCRDDRMHLLVKLHLAAEIRKSIEVGDK